ncbi:alpha beta-hydrolase [Suillus discolor]|uniref:Alpha beta-hydrolase n=1 Tax=Suillus discolor TaxID=1912936 RepID=A0A9P7JVE7_9AGAM|nr:alpha beta-hydrolase [Suillus discolor]KAG2110572.1 alpha beta-hydrolase [Suillus discolor]
MNFCNDCIQGVRHVASLGTLETTVAGVTCYVATPTVDDAKDKVILLPDAFGMSINAQLLADDFVRNGFKAQTIIRVVAIDYFGIPADRPFKLKASLLLADAFINKSSPLTSHSTTLSNVPSSPTSHLPNDLETYFSKSAAPILINSCEHDRLFCAEAQTKADAIFGDEKFAPGYRREYFPRCTHGVTVLGDLSNSLVKAGKEGSAMANVEFFLEHL